MQVPNKTGKTEYMTAFSHPWRNRGGEADRTARRLGFLRNKNLENSIPIKMDVCIRRLSVVIILRVHDKSVVRMHISNLSLANGAVNSFLQRLVPGFIKIAGADSPWLMAPGSVRVTVRLWTRWEREVHEMGDRGLPLATCGRFHRGLEK